MQSGSMYYIDMNKGSKILTPIRIVGEEVSCDKMGPKLCAMGTITGENNGIAVLASYNIKHYIRDFHTKINVHYDSSQFRNQVEKLPSTTVKLYYFAQYFIVNN